MLARLPFYFLIVMVFANFALSGSPVLWLKMKLNMPPRNHAAKANLGLF